MRRPTDPAEPKMAEVDGNRTRRTRIARTARFEGGGAHQVPRHLRAGTYLLGGTTAGSREDGQMVGPRENDAGRDGTSADGIIRRRTRGQDDAPAELIQVARERLVQLREQVALG